MNEKRTRRLMARSSSRSQTERERERATNKAATKRALSLLSLAFHTCVCVLYYVVCLCFCFDRQCVHSVWIPTNAIEFSVPTTLARSGLTPNSTNIAPITPIEPRCSLCAVPAFDETNIRVCFSLVFHFDSNKKKKSLSIF